MIFLDHVAKWLFSALTALALTLFSGVILSPVSMMFVAPSHHHTAARSVDSSNLRQIAQACLIYSVEHQGQLPNAADLPDYARLLALHGGLNDATCWVASENRAAIPSDLTTVLAAAPDGSRTLDPRFSKLPHLFTVVLGGLTNKHPGTTPIAWTRGLDLETGKWRHDSPYGGDGGHVLFLDGHLKFYRQLTNAEGGELVSRTGTRTHRILDTLPAGTRISDNFRAPELSPPLADRLGVLFRGASDAIRAAILLAWPLWMLILFFKLTLGFARTWGVPIARLRIEPRSRWIVLTPAVLLLLSVVFQV